MELSSEAWVVLEDLVDVCNLFVVAPLNNFSEDGLQVLHERFDGAWDVLVVVLDVREDTQKEDGIQAARTLPCSVGGTVRLAGLRKILRDVGVGTLVVVLGEDTEKSCLSSGGGDHEKRPMLGIREVREELYRRRLFWSVLEGFFLPLPCP